MSGHSKWSKVKHQKAGTDAVKGQAFTKASRAISVAAREGGAKLRLAIEQARAVNMPKDTIERAIEKGKGTSGSALQSLLYEGYGPGGVAMLVSATTDNVMRTGASVRHVFEHYGGALASPGAVSFQFKRAVIFKVKKAGESFDDVLTRALEAGADDAIDTGATYDIYTYQSGETVRENLEKSGLTIQETELVMNPTATIPVSEESGERLAELITSLEELDDVSQVYTNADGSL